MNALRIQRHGDRLLLRIGLSETAFGVESLRAIANVLWNNADIIEIEQQRAARTETTPPGSTDRLRASDGDRVPTPGEKERGEAGIAQCRVPASTEVPRLATTVTKPTGSVVHVSKERSDQLMAEWEAARAASADTRWR